MLKHSPSLDVLGLQREYVEYERSRQKELQTQIDELKKQLQKEMDTASGDMGSVLSSLQVRKGYDYFCLRHHPSCASYYLQVISRQHEDKVAEEKAGVSQEDMVGHQPS